MAGRPGQSPHLYTVHPPAGRQPARSAAHSRSSAAAPRPAGRARGNNFIDVKFEHAVFPFRIHVYETYNPGGLTAVWAGDCRGGWTLLWAETPSASPSCPSPAPVRILLRF